MTILLVSAFVVGVLHAFSPDHWLPFAMMAKARCWGGRRLTGIVFLAGLIHVSAALTIGGIALFLGHSLNQITRFENSQAGVFSFLLIGFGITYSLWAFKQEKSSRQLENRKENPWPGSLLLALVAFGPCEPLIPLLFLGSFHGWGAIAALFAVFSLATIGVMILAVHTAVRGLSLNRLPWLQRFPHTFAGSMIALTGVFVRVLGL